MAKSRLDQAWEDYWQGGADVPADPMPEAKARTYGRNDTTDTAAFKAHRDRQAGNLNEVENGLGE